MSTRDAAWLAWSMWALCVPLTVFGGLLSFLTASGQIGAGSGLDILFRVLLLMFPTVGAFVVSRRPENPIGWIFCAVGLLAGVGTFAESYAQYALHASSAPLLGAQYAAWLSSWTGPGLLLAAAFLCLLFPDGRLPSRRWRLVAWIAAIGSSLTALGVAFAPGPLEARRSIANPIGIGGTPRGARSAPTRRPCRITTSSHPPSPSGAAATSSATRVSETSACIRAQLRTRVAIRSRTAAASS